MLQPMNAQSRRRAAGATFLGMGATVAITVAQAFILIPLALKHLGASLYGAWLGAFELLVWIQLLDCGIPNLMTQRIAAALGGGDTSAASRWAMTGMTWIVVLAGLLATIGFGAAPFVGRWVSVPLTEQATFTACFRLGVLASAVLLIFNGFVGLSRGVQRTALVNVSQVTAVLASLVVSAWLLIRGWGLWALPVGLLVRSLLSLFGAVVFWWRLPHAVGGGLAAPSRAFTGQVAQLAPSMSGASIGYLLANNSEVFLVAALFGPVTAATYALTRRAIDGLRNLLDSVAWAVYGGFSHLVTAADRHRARIVLGEIMWLRFAAACLCGAVALAVNEAFVRLLFGASNFGGVWLTAAFALQMVLGGQAFLANFLLRAAGEVREGSLWLAAEAVVRVAAMLSGLLTVGLAGAPAGAALVSAIAWRVMHSRLDRVLPPSEQAPASSGLRTHVTPLFIYGAGLAVALLRPPESWAQLLRIGAVVGVVGAGLLWLTVPRTSGQGALPRWL
jgi:O-antigen/teichoic acid export membrane protein